MKLLLDENLPKRLKFDFPGHQVYTVREQGWNGVSNGELMKLMIQEGFDILLTFDKNLRHQQNFKKYSITVLVLSAKSNMYKDLIKLKTQIIELLQSGTLTAGPKVIM